MAIPEWERAELRAMQALISQGYSVHRALPAAQTHRGELVFVGNDFWGLFDLLAINATTIRLVQVKSGKGYRGPSSEWQMRLSALRRPSNCVAEYWWLTEMGPWRMTRWDANGAVIPWREEGA